METFLTEFLQEYSVSHSGINFQEAFRELSSLDKKLL